MCFRPTAVFFRLLVLYLMYKGHGATIVPATKHERIIDYDQLRNAVFLKSEDILLAGDRGLHELGADLSIKQEFLCDPISCENTNKILVVTEDQNRIMICGTRNEGQCEMRSVANLSEVPTSRNLPAVSIQTHIPAVALVTKSNNMIIGYNTTDGGNFVYKIMGVMLTDFTTNANLQLGSELNNAKMPLLYFKTALSNILNVNRNYVLIHKKESANNYKSQMVIVCGSLNITIDISCSHDNKNYNLIQDADIFGPETSDELVFVGAFVSSDNPLSVSGDSVVCIQKLIQLDPQVSSSTCGEASVPVPLISSYKLPSSEGYITSIKGDMTTTTNRYIINIGTSTGRFIQLYSESTNLASLNTPLQQFAYTVVQDGAPVVAIQSYKNGAETYIVTGKKIAVYLSANCDIYKTCNETVGGKNPLCGWCFFKGRSTTQSGCNSTWISMRELCSSISVSTEAQLVGRSQTVQIATKDFPLYGIKTDDKFKCRIKETKTEAAYDSSTRNFTCTIGEIREYQTTNLELIGSREGKEFLLGEKEYLIYQCDQIKRCGQCTDKRISCQWCSEGCRSSCNANQNEPCPVVTYKEVYVPNGMESNVTFDVTIPTKYSVSCIVKDEPQAFTGTSNGDKVTCNLKITNTSVAKQVVGVLLKYGLAELDHEIDVTVYRCDILASDCTRCGALNTSKYLCHWSAGKCNAGQGGAMLCPSPTITSFSPVNAPISAATNTTITIHGTDFTNDISAVIVASVPCKTWTVNKSTDSDFSKSVVNSITCHIVSATQKHDGHVLITFHNATAQSTNLFYYQIPNITSIFPNRGIMAGGTVVTFSGKDLALGNRNIQIRYNRGTDFINCSAIDSSKIECLLPPRLKTNMDSIIAYFDAASYLFNLTFEILENPEVHNISSGSSILSGGTKINITGTNLTNANDYAVTVSYNGKETQVYCDNATKTLLQCRFPPAPKNVEQDLNVKLEQNEKVVDKSGANCQCVETSVKLYLDGYEKIFRVYYYPDPLITNFTDVKTIDKEENYITLTGSYLNLAASPEEFLVSIGESQCTELIVTSTWLKCRIPDNHDDGSQYVVVVNVGSNYKRTVGYLKYDVNNIGAIVRIVGAVLGVLIGIFVIVGLAVYGKIYMMRRKRRLLEQKLQAMEMEISSIARQEFAEMTNGMSFVNRTLVDQGLPFHGYQQYAFNVMFSSDQVLIDQVIYQGQSGQVKQSARKGLDSLEKLILNKMFLVSLVSTMEKEKRFFFKERANLSGNLCAILMGKMGYLNEVLQDLLMSLVHSAMANKTHKSLFRQCETITENLLSNWLALTLYPHLKAHSGSPLYLLFMAMQLTIENGPIDAITGDAKYSLSEEKLLRRWQSSRPDDNDVQFDGQPMTLKVIIDNGDQVYDCKVLDCDTITQVKSKCLSQIYVNYPASQLGVDPTELRLEWCAGHTAPVVLKDEDTTSIKRGCFVRLNTLAHYNVPDKANIALVDPKTLDQEDYMNIKLDFPGQAKDTTKLIRGASADVENPDDSTKWHLVKPEEDERERSAIDELYLNKLFKTKQSINEYLTTLFDHILDSELCPPPAKFICDYMDILANKFKIDENTLFAWKSHSYAARVWGRMIRQPNQLFDVHVPQYVEDSLDVIAQVLEDSLAPSAPKLSKDCPGQQQVFYSEVQRYREKAKGFQKGIQAKGEQSNVLTEFLGDLNKMQQQQQSFNKMAYLQKLYDQLSPYLDEIVDGLAANTDTKNLELDKKMREVIDMLK